MDVEIYNGTIPIRIFNSTSSAIGSVNYVTWDGFTSSNTSANPGSYTIKITAVYNGSDIVSTQTNYILNDYPDMVSKVWTRQIGSNNTDSCYSIAIDTSTNIYLTGDAKSGIDGNTPLGSNDMVLIKYDTNGNKQWVKQFGTSVSDRGHSVTIDLSGNIYIAGFYNINGSLRKYDSDGNELWTRQIGTGTATNVYSVATDVSGNVYVTGETTIGLDNNINVGNYDIFLIKFDSNGNKQWTKQMGTSLEDRGRSVTTDSSDNIFVTGWTLGGLDGNNYYGSRDIFLVKYNTNGVKQWTRQIGTATDEDGRDMVTDSAGNIYVTGLTWGGLDGNINCSGDMCLVKYDTNGNKQWTRLYGSTNTDIGQRIEIDSLNNIYVAGHTTGGLDGNTNADAGSYDVFLIKLDPNGNRQWTKQFGTSADDYGYGLAIDNARNIYIGGYTGGQLDGNISAGLQDIFLIKFSSFGVEPQIDTVNPSLGTVGTQVTITGTNFGTAQGSSSVIFNNSITAGILSWSNTQIVCTVPSSVTTGNVTITTSSGTSNGALFTVAEMIMGKVMKMDGVSVIVGAKIEVVNGQGIAVSSVTTNTTGNYSIIVLPGTYDIRVSTPGYPTVRRNGLLVNVGQKTNYDIQLETFTVATGPVVTPTTISGTDVTPVPTGEWQNYTNPNDINCLVREGNYLWYATRGGVVKWNINDNTYQLYTPANSGLANDYVNSITIDSAGTKWFGTSTGVSKFDGTAWTTYTTANSGLGNNYVNSIAIDSAGTKWFGTSSGVSKFDGTTWTTYTTANSGLARNYVNSIVIDSTGTKWFGTTSGVSKFDGTTWTTYTTANGLAYNNVYSIVIDSTGTKWFGTYGGVSKFDGTTWTTYTTANGLASNYINSITIDNVGTKWFGTESGVSKFDGTTWTTYTTANGLANIDIRSIAIDNAETKWFSTSDGVSKFDGTTWTTYTTANRLVYNNVYSIAIDTMSAKWFGTTSGVSKFDGTAWTTYTTANSGLTDNYVHSIAIDSAGTKWFGTYGGVSKFDGTTWTSYTKANSGLADNYVNSIVIDSTGTKWFGTYGGVSKFDGTTWTTYTTANGLVNNGIFSIAIDSMGTKWVSAYNSGVSKFDDTTWTSYTKANSGLADNYVNSIVIDSTGTKWFGTSGGVSKFDGTTWTTYTTANSGLGNNYVNSIAIDITGNKWFGTGAGVSKFTGGGTGDITPPTNFVGTVFSTTTIRWTWQDNSSTEDGYRIYTATNGLVVELSINTTAWTQNGLSPNTSSYVYSICSFNSSGESPKVNLSTCPVYSFANPPVDMFRTSVSSTTVKLQWNSNTNPSWTEYYCSGSSIASVGLYNLNSGWVNTTNYLFTSLIHNTTYYFKVKARNLNGVETEYSSVNSVMTAIVSTSPYINVYVPSPTGNLMAAGTGVSGQICLTWTVPLVDQSHSAAESYILYRSTINSSGYNIVATTAGTVYIDTELTNNVTYYYKTIAINSAGESAFSNTVSTYPYVSQIVLPVPTNVLVTNPATGGKLNITWTGVTVANLAGYKIYRRTSGTGYALVTTIATNISTYQDTGLTNGIRYYYVITAYDITGNESGYSTEKSEVPTGIVVSLSPPANVTVTDLHTDARLRIQWDSVTNATIYHVWRTDSINGTYQKVISTGVTISPFIDSGLLAKVTYYYKLQAADDSGNVSGYSSITSACPTSVDVTPPTVVVGISITNPQKGNKLILSWNTAVEDTDLAGYRVYRSTTSGGTYQFIGSTTPAGSAVGSGKIVTKSYQCTGLINNVTYYFVVTSYDMSGNESMQSVQVSGYPTSLTDNVPPVKPVGLTVTSDSSGKQVELTWNANKENDLKEYRILHAEGAATTEFTELAVLPKGGCTYTDIGLKNGVEYRYYVCAVDTNGNQSVPSDTQSVTPMDTQPPVIDTVETNSKTITQLGKITVSFYVGETLKQDPVVKVCGHLAVLTDKIVMGDVVYYKYAYTLREADLTTGQVVAMIIDTVDEAGLKSSRTLNIVVDVKQTENMMRVMGNRLDLQKTGSKAVIHYYLLESAAYLRLKVYNIAGELVRTIDGGQKNGWGAIEWDGKNDNGETVSSGVYFTYLESDIFKQTQKIIVIK
ncbi:MAG: SBBP repeat-containing protein [Elusimicrobiota bacterium]